MNPGNSVFSVMLHTNPALACYIFDVHQPILIIFVDNKVVLLRKVCKYYFLPFRFRDAVYSMTGWKDTISGVHVSPGSAETIARIGGITNHHLIAYSLSNIFAKNN